ncbi:ribonuclease H-like domain-containing protein [Tanacetum coccineum]
MTPSSPPSYTFLDPTPSPLLNTLTSAPIPPLTTHETTQPNNTAIPNAEPNTPYGPTPQGPTPTEPSPSPQSTLPTSTAHNHASGPSTSAYQTNPLPPPIFDPPNPQTNTNPINEPPRTHPMITWSQSGIWRNAMYDEYNALVKNGTWLLVPRPAGVNMVRSMWLFKHKFHADGTLNCYKARLVANGSSQQLGVDFDKMFSPVANQPLFAWFLALLCLIIDSFHNEFDMTDIGTLNYFLGISMDRTSTSLYLSQRKYALQLLERAHMVHCNPSRTPVDTESKLGPEGVPVCLYMHDLMEPHFAALKRILRYVRGTVDFGLQLYASATTSLVGYTDADWAGCPFTRSAVYMSANPVQHQRTKHIEIDIHFVRDMVTAGQVRVLHVPSRYQYADIFTKGLPSALFEEFYPV